MKLIAAPVPRAPAPTNPARSFLPLGAPFKMGGRPRDSVSGFLLHDDKKAPAPAKPIPASAVFPMNFLLLIHYLSLVFITFLVTHRCIGT